MSSILGCSLDAAVMLVLVCIGSCRLNWCLTGLCCYCLNLRLIVTVFNGLSVVRVKISTPTSAWIISALNPVMRNIQYCAQLKLYCVKIPFFLFYACGKLRIVENWEIIVENWEFIFLNQQKRAVYWSILFSLLVHFISFFKICTSCNRLINQ